MHPLPLVVIGALCAAPLAAAGASPRRPGPSPVRAALQPFVDSHALAGAVTAIADRNGLIRLDTVGWADVGAAAPMRADTLFWIASQSKPITAAAFMMLVDEGRANLDDPVEKYLPEFAGLRVAVERDGDHILLRRPAHAITIREILSHTSGMPFASPLEQPTLDMLSLAVGARSYAMTPLDHEPGTRYQYSNAGINTAGRIIEVISGLRFEEFLRARLFEPLGMKDTTFRPTRRQIARIARSYHPDATKSGLEAITVGQLHYPLDDPARQPMPAGGLFSTATDLVRFLRMVARGGELDGRRYLSEAAVRAMTSKQTPAALPDGYGLGWSTGGGVFGHGGAFATNMTIDSNRDIITVWLIQHAGFPGNGEQAQGAFQHAVEQVLLSRR